MTRYSICPNISRKENDKVQYVPILVERERESTVCPIISREISIKVGCVPILVEKEVKKYGMSQ